MIAAIPFWEARMVESGVRLVFGDAQVVIPTFGVPVDPWALLVCLGVLSGLELARYRAIKMGIDVRDLVDGVVFTVLIGFFMAHVITVVGYYPERLRTDGIWAILKVWEGFSSTGGFLGAIPAIYVFYRWIRPQPIMRMADIIAYGFPLGWVFGRLGCSVVHDHIGQPTDFFLGMAFPAGHYAAIGGEMTIRHELGFYELLWTVPVFLWFLWLGRKDQAPGTFMGWFFVLYAPVRFGLDFLRNTDLAYADARYLGLTPAQYGVVAMGLFGAWLLWRRPKDFEPWPLDGEPDQAERAGEAAA